MLTFEAHAERARDEHNKALFLAWHIAALSRTQKRFPPLKSILIKEPVPRQSWQQQLVIARMWSARRLGTIRRIN